MYENTHCVFFWDVTCPSRLAQWFVLPHSKNGTNPPSLCWGFTLPPSCMVREASLR